LGIIVFLIGATIGLVAVFTQKPGNFNIRPYIKDDCKLVTHGIYSYIRHPMYLSVLIMMFGIFFIYLKIIQFILYLLLVIVLIEKLNYEEKLWLKHDNRYCEYKKNTKKLIPFIW